MCQVGTRTVLTQEQLYEILWKALNYTINQNRVYETITTYLTQDKLKYLFGLHIK